jgi:hypothetical protein
MTIGHKVGRLGFGSSLTSNPAVVVAVHCRRRTRPRGLLATCRRRPPSDLRSSVLVPIRVACLAPSKLSSPSSRALLTSATLDSIRELRCPIKSVYSLCVKKTTERDKSLPSWLHLVLPPLSCSRMPPLMATTFGSGPRCFVCALAINGFGDISLATILAFRSWFILPNLALIPSSTTTTTTKHFILK